MTANATRARVLMDALRASVEGDTTVIARAYTDDVRAWGPAFSASSVEELAAVFEHRDEAFSDISLDLTPLDVAGECACVEWSVSMTHTGDLLLADGATLEPTGLRITLQGVTVAEFEGDRICSLRQYWDELSALEQLGVLGAEEPTT
jgi:ketosteroid isomerase-like protein